MCMGFFFSVQCTRKIFRSVSISNEEFFFTLASKSKKIQPFILGKIIPNSPADQCGQLHINDRILAVNGVDLTQMVHTDVVNLIKDSGRTITLKIGPPIPYGKTIIKRKVFSNLFSLKMTDLRKVPIHI